jgi:DNA-binding MarR family transcriptional regulator
LVTEPSEMSNSEEEPLGSLLHRMVAMLRPEVSAELRPLGLSLPEFVCLRMLSLQPKRSSADLARDSHVTAQAMNQLLHKLQQLGVVTRPASAAAGRTLPAELTPEGYALLERAERAVHIADRRAIGRLTPPEQRQLRMLLRKATS